MPKTLKKSANKNQLENIDDPDSCLYTWPPFHHLLPIFDLNDTPLTHLDPSIQNENISKTLFPNNIY